MPRTRETNVRDGRQNLTSAYDFTNFDAGHRFDNSNEELVHVPKHNMRYDTPYEDQYAPTSEASQSLVYKSASQRLKLDVPPKLTSRNQQHAQKKASKIVSTDQSVSKSTSGIQRQTSVFRKEEPYKQRSHQLSFPDAPTDLSRRNTRAYSHKIEPRESSSVRRSKTTRYPIRQDSASGTSYLERKESGRSGYPLGGSGMTSQMSDRVGQSRPQTPYSEYPEAIPTPVEFDASQEHFVRSESRRRAEYSSVSVREPPFRQDSFFKYDEEHFVEYDSSSESDSSPEDGSSPEYSPILERHPMMRRVSEPRQQERSLSRTMPQVATQSRPRHPCEDCPYYTGVPCFDIEDDHDICSTGGDHDFERNDSGRMQSSRRAREKRSAGKGGWSGTMFDHVARNI